MSEQLSISLSTDEDGFLSQECPTCLRRFKVVFNEGSDKPLSFCPYCRHEGTDCWWTPEQAEYLSGTVANEFFRPELEEMARAINSSGSSSSFVSMSMTLDPPEHVAQPSELNEALPIMVFRCCNERIKYHPLGATLHCVICGTATTVA